MPLYVNPLKAESNLSDLASAVTARANLGVPAPVGNRVVVIGDSIAGGTTGGSWTQALMIAAAGRMNIVKNSGIGGNNSTQMVARFATDVVAYTPDWCIIESVTPNDPGQSISVATTKTNTQALVSACLAAGIRPIVCLGPPSDTTGYRDHMLNVNAWLAPWARARGITVFDLYTPVCDPTDGTYATAMQTDGTHLSNAGAVAVATWNLSLLPYDMQFVPILSGGMNDPANMLLDGAFAVDSNSDGVANSWFIGSGFATKSLSAVSSAIGIGNWQMLTCAGGTEYFASNNITTGFADGDLIEFSCGLQSTGGAMALAVRPYINGGGLTVTDVLSSTLVLPATTVIVGRWVMPAGSTTIAMRFICTLAAGTIGIRQATMRNLTALGVA